MGKNVRKLFKESSSVQKCQKIFWYLNSFSFNVTVKMSEIDTKKLLKCLINFLTFLEPFFDILFSRNKNLEYLKNRKKIIRYNPSKISKKFVENFMTILVNVKNDAYRQFFRAQACSRAGISVVARTESVIFIRIMSHNL